MSPFVRTHNDFLLTFHSVHLVYLVPFSRQRAISVENRKKNPTPLYFASQLKEFSLDLALGTSLGGQKTSMMGLYRADKKFDDIFCRLDHTMHQRDRQTYTM